MLLLTLCSRCTGSFVKSIPARNEKTRLIIAEIVLYIDTLVRSNGTPQNNVPGCMLRALVIFVQNLTDICVDCLSSQYSLEA